VEPPVTIGTTTPQLRTKKGRRSRRTTAEAYSCRYETEEDRCTIVSGPSNAVALKQANVYRADRESISTSPASWACVSELRSARPAQAASRALARLMICSTTATCSTSTRP